MQKPRLPSFPDHETAQETDEELHAIQAYASMLREAHLCAELHPDETNEAG